MRAPSLAAIACGLLALSVGELPAVAGGALLAQARAADDWDAEFESVCSRTQDAMTIPSDELKSLIARCDRLKPGLAKLDDSRRKVYAKRLKMCRDLFDFVLGSPAFAGRVTGAEIDREERAGKGASDHAPVIVELSD